jgi:gamma-glutamyltranspeptidase / glutathione hydrolase
MKTLDYAMPYASARSPVFGRAAVAASQPLATAAGIEMLLAGGNAVDAAVAAAMTLTVVEPTGCGLGSDAFAIVWDGERLHGLDASGRSPAAWTPERFAGRTRMPTRGWDAVTVPGVVSGWVALSRRFGRLPFERLATPAIRHAREGFAVTPIIADLWARVAPILKDQPGFADGFLPDGRAPAAGQIFRSEAHARSLEEIARTGGESFYRGALAEAIIGQARRDGGALSLDDLGEHCADWVQPMSQSFAGLIVHELPPAGQGVATLMALGILEALAFDRGEPDDPRTTHVAIEATKLALADLYAHVGDREAMTVRLEHLLDPAYLAARGELIDSSYAGDPGHGAPGPGGTVCLSTADAEGMMVSFIQSNYLHFGSGVVVPGTGISLQNRGAGFNLTSGHPNAVGPHKRPFHTIIPGFASDADGAPRMAFGLMGGPMQAQGHVQLALRILAAGQNPQAAADAPRWRLLGGRGLAVEPEMAPHAVETLGRLGHEVVLESDKESFGFGGAQIVLRTEGGYVAGSDPRKDGLAIGL